MKFNFSRAEIILFLLRSKLTFHDKSKSWRVYLVNLYLKNTT